MEQIKLSYKGNLRTEYVHENGSVITTDGPKEVGGKGEFLSPTDMFALSLMSCTVTMLGFTANKLNFDLGKTSATVEKEMTSSGARRVSKLNVVVSSSANPNPETKKSLEDAALHCPVHLSIHPETNISVTFKWNIQ